MKLTDILDSARKATPNMELEVFDENGEAVDLIFRNIAGMPKEDRARLADASKNLEDDVADADENDTDKVAELAEQSKRFLQIVAKTEEQFALLEWALSLDRDIEDLAWISLFSSYAEETQLGEAVSSQNS